ncbi:MAG: hypothetical protein L3J41_03680 [Melioribacteraceae bacterium]|nr:hypothetical protein [Melioribacteraceae bacterium]
MKNTHSVLMVFSLIFLMLFSLGCSKEEDKLIKDIIPNINLEFNSEKEIVISDLFFSNNYALTFAENQHISIKHVKESNSITLKTKSDFVGMTLVEFTLDDNVYSIPATIHKNESYKFQFTPDKKYNELYLFGSFNGWNRKEIAMTDEDGDGTFEAEATLEPGVYAYKFFGDGEEIVDPVNPNKVPNGFGSFNSIRTIATDISEDIFLHVLNFNEGNRVLNFGIEGSQFAKDLNSKNIIALLDNKIIAADNIKLNQSNIAVTLPASVLNGKKLIRLAVTKDGRTTNFQHLLLEDGEPINNNSKFNWYDGVIYSLMIDRFNDGDTSLNNPVQHDSLSDKANYIGGDLQGVIDKLNSNYFNNLGINTIWISPVYDNPNIAFREYPEPHRWYSGYHGYWPISSTRVEEKFGNMKKLKELIDVAHKHNIKILLDFVSNHVHKDHPYYQNHKDWFGKLDLPDGRKNIRFWDEFRLTTWFEPYLPSYDFLGSETVLDTITANAVWWLKETGADGYRHDAVKHVPNKFWRKLTKELKREIEIPRNRPLYQVGETFGSYDLISSYVNNGQLSAQFNFSLYDVALPTFIDRDASFDRLDKEMQKTFSVYGPLHLMSNVMDSHDKNRFMAYADGDLDVSQWSAIEQGWNNPPKVDNPDNYKKLILYMAFMNTIPGLPVIYYGSEFGMTGASDPDNRRMMRFDDALSLYEKETMKEVSQIINLRNNHTALRYGDYYKLIADDNRYAYIRSDLNERILVVLNKGDKYQTIKLVIPNVYKASKLVSLIDDYEIDVSESEVSIKLNGMGYNIYSIK